jgi:hypothetical protein
MGLLYLYLTLNGHGGMEILLNAFVISALVQVSDQLHAMAALSSRKVYPISIKYNSQMNANY